MAATRFRAHWVWEEADCLFVISCFLKKKIQIEQFYYILFPLYFISFNPKFSFEELKPLIVQGGEREAQCQ